MTFSEGIKQRWRISNKPMYRRIIWLDILCSTVGGETFRLEKKNENVIILLRDSHVNFFFRVATQIHPKNSLTFPGFSRSFSLSAAITIAKTRN